MSQSGGGSAEARLGALIDRLLAAAEAAAAVRNWDETQALVDDVLAVDPDNARASQLQARVNMAREAPTGQRALMSVFFSDLVESTPLAERAEPEVVRDLYEMYRETAQQAVDEFGGHLVKFLGDGIIACFGYPDSHEDDARRAVLSGLALQEGMAKVRHTAQEKHGVDLQVRVGIHTGVVVVADLGIGSGRERDAIVGVTPNIASRLQSEAEPGMVVVSDVTEQLIERDFELVSRGLRELKGISRPVEVFAVTGRKQIGAQLEHERLHRGTLVGRHALRAQLWDAWQAVEASMSDPDAEPTPSFLLTGEAGIGKSRLVAGLRTIAASTETDILELGCLPSYSNSAFWPVTQMLERFMELHADDPAERRLAVLVDHLSAAGIEPEGAVPLVGPLVRVVPDQDYPAPQLDPTALRQATLDVLARWLGRASGSRPRLVIAEDMHWADPSTVEFLGRLVSAPERGVLVVMTSRHPVDLPAAAALETLTLDRLSDEDAEALIKDLAGDEDFPESTMRSVVARGEGIPLFIEELTRAALARPGDEVFPLRLQELLTARLNAPSIDLRLVQLAATLGPVFDEPMLAAVVDEPIDVKRSLADLAEAGIIQHTGHPDGTQYRFRHALLRDAAYETQVLETRQQTHRLVAGALADTVGGAALIAHHLDLGGASGEAVGQYMVAAQEAQSRGAHQEATQLTTRALELIDDWPAGPDRDGMELTMLMLRSLSVSSVRGYAAPEVLDDFRRAEAISEQLGTAPELMPAVIAIWAYWLVNGHVPTARHLADRLLAMVEDETTSWFRPEVHSCVGFQAVYEGDLVAARKEFDLAFEGYDARDPEQMVSEFWPLPNDPVAVSAVGMAVVQTLAGDCEGGEAWEARAVERAESVPFPRGPFTLAFVKTYMAWLRWTTGDTAAAEQLSADILGIAQQHGYAYWMALGALYHRATDPSAEHLEQAIATLQAIGHEAFRASYLASLAELHRAAADDEQARATVSEAMLVAEKSGEKLHLPELHRLRAALLLEANGAAAAEDAVADLRRAEELAGDGGAALLALRAAIDLGRLPDDLRPSDWRDVVKKRRAAMPDGSSCRELAIADDLLS